MRAAAVTGLAAEARLARRIGLAAAAGGGGAARTRQLAERLLADGADGLVSFGICGGLAPDAASGTLLLPHVVLGEGGKRWPVDEAWRARAAALLSAIGIPFAAGDLLGATEIAAEKIAKWYLYRRSGAVAVDLESHIVAAAARAAGRPFVVLRAIADPAERRLPPAAVSGLDAEGRAAIGRVFLSLLQDPAQLPALLRVASDVRGALKSLQRGAAAARAALLLEDG